MTEPSTPNWLRWLAVVPASLLGAVASTFVLKLVLYQTLTGSGLVEPYPETPERLLTPLVMSLAFVWAGAATAPRSNVRVAGILAGTYSVLVVATLLLVTGGVGFNGLHLDLQFGGLPSALGVLGAFLGFFAARSQFGSSRT